MPFGGSKLNLYSVPLNTIGVFIAKILYQVNGDSLRTEDGQNVTLIMHLSLVRIQEMEIKKLHYLTRNTGLLVIKPKCFRLCSITVKQ